MLPRFYVPDLTRDTLAVELPSDESHHARHVLRLGPGDHIRLFDGRGHERLATVTRTGARVRADVGEPISPAREAAVQIELVMSLLKGEHMDAAIRDAVMMGAARITPVVSAHTVSRPRAQAEGRLAERWSRIAVASVKQCGRAVVPAIGPVRDLAAVLADVGSHVRIILVEPALAAGRAPDLGALSAEARSAGATVLVGPEGGWARDEFDRAVSNGFLPWSLGPRTLRADAVPTAALAVLLYAWDRELTPTPSGAAE